MCTVMNRIGTVYSCKGRFLSKVVRTVLPLEELRTFNVRYVAVDGSCVICVSFDEL